MNSRKDEDLYLIADNKELTDIAAVKVRLDGIVDMSDPPIYSLLITYTDGEIAHKSGNVDTILMNFSAFLDPEILDKLKSEMSDWRKPYIDYGFTFDECRIAELGMADEKLQERFSKAAAEFKKQKESQLTKHSLFRPTESCTSITAERTQLKP